MGRAALLAACLLLAGCAARRIATPGVSLLLANECLTAPVRMTGCDQAQPPRCKTIIVHYRKGCEIVDARLGPR